ncbi:MAG TPA: metalloregulator ArsR/SmtB family transcription factor [Pyrinomonadaceae bacterium]|jgi:DNA-binding transcriptional ArsR family regulator|nr:metalloregulator ArsR/SmtB family transcription factor [Pyrinomonadaceae bacterium]
MESQFVEFERLFLGLGDKTRLRLLGLVANGPVSVGYLVEQLGESQPKVSRHLAYLRGTGLVETSRDGKWIYYGIAEQQQPGCEVVLRTLLAELVGPSDGPERRKPLVGDWSSNHDDEPQASWDVGDDYSEEYDRAPAPEQASDELEIFLL